MQFVFDESAHDPVRRIFERICAHFGYSAEFSEPKLIPHKTAIPASQLVSRHDVAITLHSTASDAEFPSVGIVLSLFGDGSANVSSAKDYGITKEDSRCFKLIGDILGTTAVAVIAFTNAKAHLIPDPRRAITHWLDYVENAETIFGTIPKKKFRRLCSEVGAVGRGYPQRVNDIMSLRREKERAEIMDTCYAIANGVSDKMGTTLYARAATRKRLENRAFRIIASASLGKVDVREMPKTLPEMRQLHHELRLLRDIWRNAPRIPDDAHNEIFRELDLRGKDLQTRIAPTETGHAYCRAYAAKMGVDALMDAAMDGVPLDDLLA